MSRHIRIGVFIPNNAQMLDVATVDVLGVMSKEYFSELAEVMPAHVATIAPAVSIYYITVPSQGGEIPLTSNGILKATHSYTDDEVAPGNLDIVVVPGPDPTAEFEKGSLGWLRRQSETEGVDVLSICTGLYVCASAGIADGRLASGPRGAQGVLEKKFPKVKLVGDNQRWVRDGNFWSSGMYSSLQMGTFMVLTTTRRRDKRQRSHGGVCEGFGAVAATGGGDGAAYDGG